MIEPGTAIRCLAVVALIGVPFRADAQATCSDAPLAVQVLGSGGLFAGSDRASASYLIWQAGRPIIMIDAGEGSLQKFAEAGADLADLDLLAISRADPEHVADLARILERSAALRERPLQLVGPGGDGAFLSLVSAARGDRDDLVDVHVVEWRGFPPAPLYVGEFAVDAMNVPHGSWQDASAQSVAYRVRVGDTTLVFGGDQNATLYSFLDFADDAELLVMHLALSEYADEALRELHAVPSIVARVAWQAKVDRLLLGQIVDPPLDHPNRGAFSGPGLQESVREMRFRYSGPIDVASDLQCIPLM